MIMKSNNLKLMSSNRNLTDYSSIQADGVKTFTLQILEPDYTHELTKCPKYIRNYHCCIGWLFLQQAVSVKWVKKKTNICICF